MVSMAVSRDLVFLGGAVPASTVATLVLRRTSIMRTPQPEFLRRCGPWAKPALAAWMLAANAVTIGPLWWSPGRARLLLKHGHS